MNLTFDRAKLLIGAALLALAPMVASAREPVVGGPCEECESVYVQIPAHIPSVARIAPPEEPGTPLRIEGTDSRSQRQTGRGRDRLRLSHQ